MRRRSSRSPRPPSRSSSTSSTPCCAARSRRRSGSSAWCSQSAGSRRSPARSRRSSARACSSSTRAASCSCSTPSAAGSGPRSWTVLRDGVRERIGRRDHVQFMPALEDPSRGLAIPVASEGGAGSGVPAPEAWLVAVKDDAPLSDFDRLALRQAVTIVALELLRERVAGDTERRLAGDVLAGLLAGELTGHRPAAAARAVRPPRQRRCAGAAKARQRQQRQRPRRRASSWPRRRWPPRCAPRRPRRWSPPTARSSR